MKPLGSREIRTPRLLLRPPRKGDGAALAQTGAVAMSPVDMEQAMLSIMADARKPYGFQWVVELNGQVIGRVTGYEADPFNGHVQLAYLLAPAYRGHGLMTEAASAVVRYLLTDVAANRVWCRVRRSNGASLRVCAKLGMQHEGTLRQHYQLQNGQYEDVLIYGILRSDMDGET